MSIATNTSSSVKLTVLVDNNAAEGLAAEHGYCLWIEMPTQILLFDTGNKDALTENAKQLGKDLSMVDSLILSHGHYDHTGGVETVLDLSKKAQIYLHQGAFQPRYVKDGDSARPVRVPGNSLRALDRFEEKNRIHWATRPLTISADIGITGPIPRNNDFEDVGGDFYLDPECSRPDLIEDDLALWIKTGQGLVICVGCSHAGIVNSIERVRAITGEDRIHTVIGGMHLLHASGQRLSRTVQALNRMEIGRLIPCHCTGEEAVNYLEANLDCEVVKGYAGMQLKV